jgi:hypothetical protein
VDRLIHTSPRLSADQVSWANGNLVKFASRFANTTAFDPSCGFDGPDAEAVNAALQFLKLTAENFFQYDKRLASDADIQDCIQITLIRTWEWLKKPTCTPVEKPRAYFTKLMRRVASDYQKSIRRRARFESCLNSTFKLERDEKPAHVFDYEAFCRYLWNHQACKLVETLSIFLECECSLTATSRVLRISLPTLRKRLREIRAYAKQYLIAEW